MDIYKLMGYLPITILMIAVAAGFFYYIKNGRKLQKDSIAELEEDNEQKTVTDVQQAEQERISTLAEVENAPVAQEETDEPKEVKPLVELLETLNDYTLKWCNTADSIKEIFQEIVDSHSQCFVEGKAYVSFSRDPISLKTMAVEIEFDKDESVMTIEEITSLFQDIQEKGFDIRRTEIGKGFSKGKKSLLLYVN